MNAAIQTYKDARLTPEARWLLMQWASVIGIEKNIDGSLQTIFKRLGLTYAQGRRAWDVLIGKHTESQKRFVEIERLPSAGGGRPKSRYHLSAKLVKSLLMSPSASEHHAEEIATLAKTTLLSAENRAKNLVRDGRLRGSRLTLPNRWLLMVLLAHADTPGVITRLGISKMRLLTGMSRSRIDRQLKKLVDVGVIAHRQPGRYTSQASTRKTSIYFLDLAHPLLGAFTRTPLTIVSLPSTKKPKQTELVDGIVDAVMTAGVCSLQIKALLEEYDVITASESIAEDDTMPRSKPEHDPYRKAKSYQEKYDKIKRVLNHARAQLPSTRYLDGGIAELLKGYDAKDADWLLTSIHIDACLLLSSAWGDVKKGQLGPGQPCHDIIVNTAQRLGLKPEYTIEKSVQSSTHANHQCTQDIDNCSIADSTVERASHHPLAVLSYALSHHLARKLQKSFSVTKQFEVEAITYMLIPDFSQVSGSQPRPAYQLRGYGFGVSGADTKTVRVFFMDPVNEDLKIYWQTHYQDCFRAINDEPSDPTEDSPPADQ